MTYLTAERRFPDTSANDAALAGTAELMEGLIAACALMAHADGEIAGAERRRMFTILREHPAMTAFSRHDLAEEIATHEANFRYDPELAQQMAREKLLPLVGDQRAATRIVAACRALIRADGVEHPAEYRALAEIRELLEHRDPDDTRTTAAVSR